MFTGSCCFATPHVVYSKKTSEEVKMAQKKSLTAAQLAEKRQTRFAFACVANILYIIPCLSCLAMAVLIDGFVPSFVIAIVTMLLNLPVSLVILDLYKKKKGRGIAIILCAVMLVLHLVCCMMIGAWYIIMAPSFILYCLIIAWSEIILNH